MSNTDQKFEVGQTVSWTSQGGGASAAKKGTIFKVILAGQTPAPPRLLRDEVFPRHKVMFDGPRTTTRNGLSYLVEVRPDKGKAKPRLYWPRTSLLRLEGQP